MKAVGNVTSRRWFEIWQRYLRRCARDLAHFRRSQQGATAVEFALIAPAFLAMLIAVLQTCVFVFAQQTLQNAAMQAGRLIMTGQVQNGNVTQRSVSELHLPDDAEPYSFTAPNRRRN